MPLNNMSIFFWNISPASAAPNGTHIYQYSNWHENVLKWFLLSFRLWYLELASISLMFLTDQCLINALLNHAGSQQNLTFPLALGTKMKLLHHPDVSSKLAASIAIPTLLSVASAMYNLLFCVVHDMDSCPLSLTKNVSSKHPIPEKRSLKVA